MHSTIENWANDQGLEIGCWMGKGDFGEAYSTECGKIIKETSDPKEFLAAFHLQGSTSEYLVDIYKADMTDDGSLFILMEELDTSGVEDTFSQAQDLVDEHAFGEWEYFDEDDLPEDAFADPEALQMINDICASVMELRQKGIDLPDIQDGNIGKKNGQYVLFDFRMETELSHDLLRDFINESKQETSMTAKNHSLNTSNTSIPSP